MMMADDRDGCQATSGDENDHLWTQDDFDRLIDTFHAPEFWLPQNAISYGLLYKIIQQMEGKGLLQSTLPNLLMVLKPEIHVEGIPRFSNIKRKLKAKSTDMQTTVPWTESSVDPSIGPLCAAQHITPAFLDGVDDIILSQDITNGVILEIRNYWWRKNLQWKVFCQWLERMGIPDLSVENVRQKVNFLQKKHLTLLTKHKVQEVKDLLKAPFISKQTSATTSSYNSAPNHVPAAVVAKALTSTPRTQDHTPVIQSSSESSVPDAGSEDTINLVAFNHVPAAILVKVLTSRPLTQYRAPVIPSSNGTSVPETVNGDLIKREKATSEDTFTGSSGPSCSRSQESQIVDVKHETVIEEPVCPKSEFKWEGSIVEDDTKPRQKHVCCPGPVSSWKQKSQIVNVKHEIGLEESASSKSELKWEDSVEPWQVYKDGEFIRHIWDDGVRNQSSERTNNVNPDICSTSKLEKPMEHQSNVAMTFEQTVNSTCSSSSTEELALNPMPIVDMRASELGQLFHCELCDFIFQDHNLMERHMRNHMREKRYRCSVCDHSCTSKSHLILHMRAHTGEKPFKCTVCDYMCMSKSGLTLHLRTHTGEKLFKCKFCGHSCVRKRALTVHMRTHTGEKPFKCTVCEYRSTQHYYLAKHMRTHTGEKHIVCLLCEYRCMSNRELTVHMRTHTGEKPFKCKLCEYRCASKSGLTVHTRTHTGEKPFKCTLCEYKCTAQSNIAEHVRIHTGEKPYKCTMCGYRFTQRRTLANHMRTHTGEKPIKCAVCEYRCIQQSNLTKHMRIHTGEKPFRCTWCEYRCTTQSNLAEHMRIHTGEKPFKCTVCGYRFTQRRTLSNHMRTHTGEKPIKCAVCEYRCIQQSNLTNHMRIHTGELKCKLQVQVYK